MGVKELNKHSEVKNLNWQNNIIELGGTEEKHLVSGKVKRFRLEPQDKKTKVPKRMFGNFFSNYQLLLLFLLLYRY